MRTLALFRHAKSSWSDESLDDFDRPLAERGKKAAPKMGRALAELGPGVDLILCSPSRRTRETLDLMLPELRPAKPKCVFEDRLYHGLPEQLLGAVHDRSETAEHIVLIGHNPGLEVLAMRLTGTGKREDIEAMVEKFPTAALAQLTFDVDDWPALRFGGGYLNAFLTPRKHA